MPNVDAMINLIREGRDNEALAALKTSPGLAAARSDQDGHLHGASPLHWAGHRNAVQVCERLIELRADRSSPSDGPILDDQAWNFAEIAYVAG